MGFAYFTRRKWWVLKKEEEYLGFVTDDVTELTLYPSKSTAIEHAEHGEYPVEVCFADVQ